MQIRIKNLILGAGNSGLIANWKIDDKENTILIDRSFSQKTEYAVFLRNKYPFTYNKIDSFTNYHSSGCTNFNDEFSLKLYGSKSEKEIAFKNGEQKDVYEIDQLPLIEAANIYGNIEVIKIDLNKREVHCNVINLNKKAIFKYENLINTIPVFQFSKLAGIDLLNDFGLFITYYPIGIKTKPADESKEAIYIDYYSDPEIPFYRTHIINGKVIYEYCMNKKINDRFSFVSIPGKFLPVDDHSLVRWYEYCDHLNIFHASRFASWHPDFLIEDIIDPSRDYSFSSHIETLIEATR